jgi:hypothetical protein
LNPRLLTCTFSLFARIQTACAEWVELDEKLLVTVQKSFSCTQLSKAFYFHSDPGIPGANPM